MRLRSWLALALAAAALLPAVVQAAVLTVVNDTSDYVTVNVNGLYGCNTAPGTTCTIPLATGQHHIRGCKANGACAERWIELDEDGETITYTDA